MGDPSLRLSFGNVAETYHRVRPPYSQELLDRAQSELELEACAHVLDLAAGTGRLTRELARRFAHVIAVEPNDEMRALISDGDVRAGAAEAIPAEDASVDAVFVGEAFHWFDAARRDRGDRARPPSARRARDRVGALVGDRAASPGRGARDPERTVPAVQRAAEPALGRRVRRSGRSSRCATSASRTRPMLDPDRLLELYSTTSSLAALPHGERAELFARVRPLLERDYGLPIKHELAWTRSRYA